MAKKVESDAPKTGVDRWREATHSEESVAAKGSRGKKTGGAAAKACRTRLAFAAVLCAVAVACGIGFYGSLQLGVDVSGGTELAFSAWQEGDGPSQDEMSQAAGILRARLSSKGISGAAVKVDGDTGLLVDVPATDDADSLAESIGQTGKLEFVRVDEIGDAEALAKIQNGTEGVELSSGTYTAFLDGSHVTKCQIQLASSSSSDSSSSSYAVVVTFDDEGAQTFADVTKELAESSGQIAVVVDGVVKTAPSVSSEIDGGTVSISGSFTLDEAMQLKTSLDSGTLPVNLTYGESRDLAPVLGVKQALIAFAALVAAFAVIGLVSFRLSGVLAALSCALTGALTFGCLAVLAAAGASFAFSLPTIAGIGAASALSALGTLALLATFSKAIRAGRSPKSASLSAGASASKPCGVVMAAGFALAALFSLVGGGELMGLAVSLSVGVACAAASTLLVSVACLRLLGLGAAKKNPGLWGIKGALAAAAQTASPADAAEAEDGE